MLAIAKTQRRERGVNRRARERLRTELEADLADVLASFRQGITREGALLAVAGGDARVIVNPGSPNDLELQLVSVLSTRLEQALERGVEIGFRFAPPRLAGVPITLATEAAVGYVQRSAATAALGLTETTRDGIREILALGLQDQLAPAEVAQRVGNLAGLTPRQVRAAETFRRVRTERLAPVPEALTPQVQAVIDRDVERFRERAVLLRGRTIAETELQDAITQGERAFWDRAVLEGAADPSATFKTWRTVADTRVCPICEPLHGQTVRIDEAFSTSVGPLDGPSAHPRCRCYVQYGQLDSSGVAGGEPDSLSRSVAAQRDRRLLEAETVREDLEVARARWIRLDTATRRLAPGSRALERHEGLLASAAATVASLEARLEDLEAA